MRKKILLLLVSIPIIVGLSIWLFLVFTNKRNTIECEINGHAYAVTYPYRCLNHSCRISDKEIVGDVAKIIARLQHFSSDTIYSSNPSKMGQCCKIIPLEKVLEKNEIALFLLHKYKVSSDTTIEMGYLLETSGYSDYGNHKERTALTTFSNLTQNLRTLTNENIVWEGHSDSTIEVSYKIFSMHNLEEISEFLQQQYNMTLHKSAETPSVIITYKVE